MRTYKNYRHTKDIIVHNIKMLKTHPKVIHKNLYKRKRQSEAQSRKQQDWTVIECKGEWCSIETERCQKRETPWINSDGRNA